MDQIRDQIAGYLGHYIGIAWRAAGLSWDEDNEAEMDILADKILLGAEWAARQELRDHLIDVDHYAATGGA